MRYKVFEIFLNKDDKIELEPVNNFKLTKPEMALIELTLDKGMDYGFIPAKETLSLSYHRKGLHRSGKNRGFWQNSLSRWRICHY